MENKGIMSYISLYYVSILCEYQDKKGTQKGNKMQHKPSRVPGTEERTVDHTNKERASHTTGEITEGALNVSRN
jgi:hypothetical protein